MTIRTGLFIVLQVVAIVSVQTDPCTNYTPLNDSTLLTTYSTQPGDTIPVLPTTTGWYRYETTTDGLISTTCPTGNQCGSDRQIWINGSLPTSPGAVKNATLCRRRGSDCCQGGNSMEVKYCSTFLVFKLTPIVGARLCFQDTRSTSGSTAKHNNTGSPIVTSTIDPTKSQASALPHVGIQICVLLMCTIAAFCRYCRL